jgi:2-aminoadipate transaminase
VVRSASPRLARRSDDLVGSLIDSSTSLLAAQRHDVVRFAVGAPNEELIPVDDFDRYFGQPSPGKYDYGSSEGEAHFIETVVELLAAYGEDTRPDRLVITAGGMQGLDIAFKMFVDPGDLVVVESPTYTNGLSTALSYGASVLEVPVDDNGMVVEYLPELVASTGSVPQAVYVIPNFQNPSGTTLSLERRLMLLELVDRWDCVLIDDDPYGLLRFEGRDIPTFRQLDPHNRHVFSVRTMSKILAPGLRVGWIDASPEFRQLIVNSKQAMDTCTNVPAQMAMDGYLRSGSFDSHLAFLRETYRERKHAMVAAVDELLGEDAIHTSPEGGLFLWLRLQGRLAGIDTSELFHLALKRGVAFIPGPAFTRTDRFTDSLRLGYATSNNERIRVGVERLADSLEMVLAQLTGDFP